jgi:hypothetical protein
MMVSGAPKLLLRLEGLAVLVSAAAAYGGYAGGSWPMFAVLLLVPDIGLVGYLANARVGAITYNAMHTYAAPIALAFMKPLLGPIAFRLALIWIAHIGLDRMMGFGLKYGSAFRDTHLGVLGSRRPAHAGS